MAGSGFDNLPDTFAKINFYIGSYVEDQNIMTASVDLVLTIFKAIEETVKFYTSNQGTSNQTQDYNHQYYYPYTKC